jgi:hypothetical protein
MIKQTVREQTLTEENVKLKRKLDKVKQEATVPGRKILHLPKKNK